MKLPPVLPFDPSDRDWLLTLAELGKLVGVNDRIDLRDWLIGQRFHLKRSRLGENNQICLCVAKRDWPQIAARRVAFGFALPPGVEAPPLNKLEQYLHDQAMKPQPER